MNLSLGDACEWPQAPLAAAADRLVRNGVVAVVALGNDGAPGAFGARVPGVGSKVIGVTSFDNTNNNTLSFKTSGDNTAVGYGGGIGPQQPAIPISGSYPLARTAAPATLNNGCNTAPPLGDLTGKVALIRRDSCLLYEETRTRRTRGR